MGIYWKMPFTVRLCCNTWSLHRDLTIASPPAAFCHFFAAARADTSRRASAEPPATSTVSTESALTALQLPREQLGYFQDTGVTALSKWNCHWGNVVRGKSLNIKRAGKGVVVLYPGGLCEALLSKMHQPRSCLLWAFRGGVHSRRTRWCGNTSQHRLAPKQANPASVKVKSRCAHPPCGAESHLLGHSFWVGHIHHKAVKRENIFVNFLLSFFPFNNDCYNS